jgi:GxxExxY protein
MRFEKARTNFDPIPPETNEIARQTIDAAYKVHRHFGPGLLESIYEESLIYELTKRGLRVESQVVVPVYYEDLCLRGTLKLDLLIENALVVELKSVEALMPAHKAQLITYLKVSKHRLGLLINFGSYIFKDGINRVVL